MSCLQVGGVLVVFSSLVCVVEGWSVCQAVAHAVETRERSSFEEEEADDGEAPTISYRKWRLGDQKKTADAALLGTLYMQTSFCFHFLQLLVILTFICLYVYFFINPFTAPSLPN